MRSKPDGCPRAQRLGRRGFLAAAGLMAAGVARGAKASPREARNRMPGMAGEAAKSRIRVAQIKVVPVKGGLAGNHARLMETLDAVAAQGPVDVVTTPEAFLDGYVSTLETVSKEDLVRYAIDPDRSEYAAAVAAWAKQHRSWVVYGCTRKKAGRVYNTALIFDRDGIQIGHYDKLHLQQHDLKYAPGKRLDVYDADFGLFGVMICADRRWPETVRTLALKGARIIFNPTYGMHGELNLCMMRTRSYESEVFIVFAHPMQSLVTGPTGKVIDDSEDPKQSFVVVELDLSEVDRARASGHLKGRRPDMYDL